jgi:hypothetical protein
VHDRKPCPQPSAYPSNLTDKEWALIAPRIPAAKRGGDNRTVNLREVVKRSMRRPTR